MGIFDSLRQSASSLRNRFRSEADLADRADKADRLYAQTLAKHHEYTAGTQEWCDRMQEQLDDLGQQVETALQRGDGIAAELVRVQEFSAQVGVQVRTANAAAQETLRSAKDLPRRLRRALRTGQVSASLDADNGP